MYSITYTTKKGGSGVMTSNNIADVVKKAVYQFKNKLPATVYKNGDVIGRVFEDNSCRSGWNWYIKTDDKIKK